MTISASAVRTVNWILTAQCPSRLGTVDVVTRFLREKGCYITEQQSFDDASSCRFFIRTEFRPPEEGEFDAGAFEAAFAERAAPFSMAFELTSPECLTPVVIMVSKADHCLNDLLYRYRTGSCPSPSRRWSRIILTWRRWPSGTACPTTTCRSAPTPRLSRRPRCGGSSRTVARSW